MFKKIFKRKAIHRYIIICEGEKLPNSLYSVRHLCMLKRKINKIKKSTEYKLFTVRDLKTYKLVTCFARGKSIKEALNGLEILEKRYQEELEEK